MNRRIRMVEGGILALIGFGLLPVSSQSQTWREVTSSRQSGGEDAVAVRVTYGAGELRLGPAEEGVLYHMWLRYDEDVYAPIREWDDGRLHLGIDRIQDNIRLGRRHHEGEIEVRLGTRVPMELRLDFGAGRADLDLGGLSLTDLDVRTGASDSRLEVSSPNPVELDRAMIEVGAAEFTAEGLGNLNARAIEVSAGVGSVSLDFGGDWQRDAEVEVGMGLGSLELRFPEGLGVRIEKSTFLTSFDSQGLVKRGDAYYSPDWEEADRRLTVDVNAAFGSISVVWVR